MVGWVMLLSRTRVRATVDKTVALEISAAISIEECPKNFCASFRFPPCSLTMFAAECLNFHSCATRCVKSASVVFLTSGKDREIVRHCRQPNRAVSGRGRRSYRWEFLFASILRCPPESACSSLPVTTRGRVAHKLEVREEPYERP
jgi:hypothetical protein